MIIQIWKYKGGDQDPVEWLRDFEVAALANEITNDRKIQVVCEYLEGAAASWFDEQRNLQNDALHDWTNGNNDHTNFKYTFEQQFRTQQKLDKWQDELEILQQTGTVEHYTNRFNELVWKVDPNRTIHYLIRKGYIGEDWNQPFKNGPPFKMKILSKN